MANRSVSLPRSSNRTCGFAASALPTDFMSGNGRRCGGVAGESAHAERPEISTKASLAVEFRLAHFRVAAGFHVVDENAAFHIAA